jgi:predicted nicotinamide N-methyase
VRVGITSIADAEVIGWRCDDDVDRACGKGVEDVQAVTEVEAVACAPAGEAKYAVAKGATPWGLYRAGYNPTATAEGQDALIANGTADPEARSVAIV